MTGPLTRTVDWSDGRVVMIDQTRLPGEYVTVSYETPEEVAGAIITMVVRGGPAIGAAAALGLALGARNIESDEPEQFWQRFDALCTLFAGTRPTAVNLFWAIGRMQEAARRAPPDTVREALLTEALAMLDEDVAANRALGAFGAALLPDEAAVLTHCNAGALATVGYGTALGVIRAAVEAGKRVNVFADETRPRLQGSKLTAWELARDGIDVTVLCDNAAGSLMRQRRIDAVIVGADRITANGDTANKIGTYTAAVLAQAHAIPFYVAAPLSTVDFTLPDGALIPIEERCAEEVTHIGAEALIPAGIPVLNPAFDVTPASLITAIVTEHGVAYPPYQQSLAEQRGQ